jgi:ABC-type branched-subunit amino acid transport system permease subunit
MVGHRPRNEEYAKMLASARSEAKRGTFWLSLLIGILTALLVAAAFNVPLDRRHASSMAVISARTVEVINAVSSVAGGLVGAFFGFYAAKRIVERNKRKKKLPRELALPRDHWARRA